MVNKEVMTISGVLELIKSEDRRYEQRFIDQDKARDSALLTTNTSTATAFSASKTAMEAAFAASEKVSNTAQKYIEDKFKSLDGLQEQLRQKAETFIPRTEWNITVANFAEGIKKLEAFEASILGAQQYGDKNKSNNGLVLGLIIAGSGLVLTAVAIFLHH